MDDRLYRSRTDRMLTGVAGGLAERLDVDPSLVRVVWAVSMPLTGFLTLLIYIVMALVVPDEPWPVGPEAIVTPPPTTASGEPGAPTPDPTGAAGATAAGGPTTSGPAGWPSAGWAQDRHAQRSAERAQRRAARAASRAERGRGNGPVVVGLILVGLGILLLAQQLVPAFDWGKAWPVVAIIIGGLLILGSFRRG